MVQYYWIEPSKVQMKHFSRGFEGLTLSDAAVALTTSAVV